MRAGQRSGNSNTGYSYFSASEKTWLGAFASLCAENRLSFGGRAVKFGWKLTVAMTSLLCAALSLGATWMIHTNFLHARQELLRQNSEHQLRERYALETAFSQKKDQSLYALAAQYEKEQRAWLPEAARPFPSLGKKGRFCIPICRTAFPTLLSKRPSKRGKQKRGFCKRKIHFSC